MVNFCAVLGFSNRSNREKDKGYYGIPAIKSRSNPKKQALSVKRQATWLARLRREDQNPHFGSKIKIPKDISKSILQII